MIVIANVSDGWLEAGKSYDLLEIVGGDAKTKCRVMSGEGVPALHDVHLFNIKDLDVPRNWVFTVFEGSGWSLHPKLLDQEFWQKYFEGECGAMEKLAQYIDDGDDNSL